MTSSSSSALPAYIEHLHARIRARSNTPTPRDHQENLAVLPDRVSELCKTDPRECLALIVSALEEVTSAHLVQAIGDGLLEDLLNQNAAAIHDEIARLLRSNQRFRFAFASGTHSSVDPSLINEWVELLRDLGTTKQAERKRLWRVPFQSA